MLELLQYILSSFWTFLGTFVLIEAIVYPFANAIMYLGMNRGKDDKDDESK